MRRSVLRGLLLIVVLAIGFIGGHLSAAQPHMNSALKQLRAARNSLNKASDDKGGHRTRAIALVNDAIVQVEKGIAFDRRH